MNVTVLREVYGTDFLPDVNAHPILQAVTFCDGCGRRISTANASMDVLEIRLSKEPTTFHGSCARGLTRRRRPRCDRERLRALLAKIRVEASARGRHRAAIVAGRAPGLEDR